MMAGRSSVDAKVATPKGCPQEGDPMMEADAARVFPGPKARPGQAGEKIAEIAGDAKFCPADESTPRRRLSREQVAHYNAHGYLRGLPVFGEEQVLENREGFERMFAMFSARGIDGYSINGFHTRIGYVYGLCTNPTILDYVEDLLGPNFVCWGAQFFCKLPGDPKEVSWHQDAPYWALEPTRTVTVWLAIDDVDDENSALRVVPGTHLDGPLEVRESRPDEQNALHLTLADPADMEQRAITLHLKAGEVSLHADLLVHGSRANTSHRRRCGVAIRYAASSVRATRPGWAGNAFLCRGSDPGENWANLPPPTTEDPFERADEATKASTPDEPTARAIVERIANVVRALPLEAAKVDANFELVLEGEGGGHFLLHLQGFPRVVDLDTREASLVEHVKRHATIFAAAPDYAGLVTGRLEGEELFFAGRLRVNGDLGLAMRLKDLFALLRL